MCAIAGIVGPAGLPDSHRAVQEMLSRMGHRGPDGNRVASWENHPSGSHVVLGHRRLSILDLSAAAAQPMKSADGQLHLVLNGEIYNYVELRAELISLGHHFRTQSDSEVLLEAWKAWGADALDRVTGMFAFALLDERRRMLVLARDPFGIKPLYYWMGRDRIAFASEIPPLLDVLRVPRDADPGATADFLVRGGNNHPGRTLFASVREFPAATVAEVSLDRPTDWRLRRYWRPPQALARNLGLDAAADQFRHLLAESVRIHLRSDVPFGVLLSGGKDSSSIVMLARQALGKDAEIKTFSYRGQEGAADESRWVATANSAAQARGLEVRVTAEDFAREMAALVRSQGEPFGSPVIYAQRRLYQEAAANGVRVVLDGQGSDEYLAGYDRFRPAALASLLSHGDYWVCLRQVLRRLENGRTLHTIGAAAMLRWRWLEVVRRLWEHSRSTSMDRSWSAARHAALSPTWAPAGADILREILGSALTSVNIHWLMRYADRNAMAFSIENRVPFLNRKLVDFVLGLPERHFISKDGTGKLLLQRAMRGVVPDAILNRQDRIGFDVPVEAWLARTPGVQELLHQASKIPAVNRMLALRYLNSVRHGEAIPRPRAFEAWRLVTLAAWAIEFKVNFD